MNELFRRLHYLLNRRRLDRELADEMAWHREMAARADGLPLGNTLRLREEARDAWGWTWIDRLGQDFRYAARMLWRAPGFSLAAVVILAIGIGVNVAAFGFINAVFLRPLPIRDPSSLLHFERRSPERFATDVPYPQMAFVREHTQTLSAVLAVSPARLTLDAAAAPVRAHFVTGNFFDELGVSASLGRLFTLEDDRLSAAAPPVVLSHRFWMRELRGDPSVVGRSITLERGPADILGVAAPAFGGLTLDDPDMWIPIARQPDLIRGSQLLTSYGEESGGVRMWGRMRAGATPGAVEAELESLLLTLRRQQPDGVWEHERLLSEPGGYPVRGGGSSHGTGAPPASKVRATLVMLGALALLILAVACANLGSLLLARGVSRSREMSIRIAVGAGAPRLVRQLFTESLLLACLGSLAGLGLGQTVLRLLLSLTEAPAWLATPPDWRVILFTLGVTLAAAVFFGLTPAVQVARQRRQSTRIRQVLIGAQVAASCVLLIVASLLVRALDRMVSTDPGFAYRQIIAINPGLAAHGYAPARAGAYLTALRIRLEALPGIVSVTSASTPPLGARKTVTVAVVDGRRAEIHVNHVDPDYLRTLGIPMLRGRMFGRNEIGTLVVSESLARRLWPGEDPVGRRFDDRTVVGVAGSARQNALQDPDAVEAYFPVEDGVLPSMSLLARASGRPDDLVRAVAAAARAVDPDVLAGVEMLTTAFERKQGQAELTAIAVSVLGLAALLLACVGIVGLVAYSVAQRTREIGIRIALGATGVRVIAAVLRQLSAPVAAGLLLGMGAAGALSQILRRELYGVSSLDPVAYVAAVAVFVATSTLAALWPARRALRVDPLSALKTD